MRVDGVCELLEGAQHFLLGNDDDFLGFAGKPAPGSFLELFSGVNGGDDDSDIFLGNVGGVFREGDRSVCEGGSYSNKVP